MKNVAKTITLITIIILSVIASACIHGKVPTENSGVEIKVGNIKIESPTNGDTYYPDFITASGNYVYHIPLKFSGKKGEQVEITVETPYTVTIDTKSKYYTNGGASNIQYDYDYVKNEGTISFTMASDKVTVPITILRPFGQTQNKVKMKITNNGISVVITFNVELYEINDIKIANSHDNMIQIKTPVPGKFKIPIELVGPGISKIKKIILITGVNSQITVEKLTGLTIPSISHGVWKKDAEGGVNAIIMDTEIPEGKTNAEIVFELEYKVKTTPETRAFIVLQLDDGKWVAYELILKQSTEQIGDQLTLPKNITYTISPDSEFGPIEIAWPELFTGYKITIEPQLKTSSPRIIKFENIQYDANTLTNVKILNTPYPKITADITGKGKITFHVKTDTPYFSAETFTFKVTLSKGTTVQNAKFSVVVKGIKPELNITANLTTDPNGVKFAKVTILSNAKIERKIKIYISVNNNSNTILFIRSNGRTLPLKKDSKYAIVTTNPNSRELELDVYINWMLLQGDNITMTIEIPEFNTVKTLKLQPGNKTS